MGPPDLTAGQQVPLTMLEIPAHQIGSQAVEMLMGALDEDLFGLDLADAKAVTNARRDAKEVHYVASRLGVVLGPERAQMSAFMDEIQNELGSLSIASDNQKLASEFSKSPRFRGVRADLGVVARDQAEVVSATLSGLRRREARSAKGKTAKKDKDSKN